MSFCINFHGIHVGLFVSADFYLGLPFLLLFFSSHLIFCCLSLIECVFAAYLL